ncbi:MAG: YggT family protein [Dehalococcoidia bacterium]
MDFELAARFVQILSYILMVAIFIRIIFSWIGMDPDNPMAIFLNNITEPIMAPIRQFIPRVGMLDLTPMVAIILLMFIARIVTRLLLLA